MPELVPYSDAWFNAKCEDRLTAIEFIAHLSIETRIIFDIDRGPGCSHPDNASVEGLALHMQMVNEFTGAKTK